MVWILQTFSKPVVLLVLFSNLLFAKVSGTGSPDSGGTATNYVITARELDLISTQLMYWFSDEGGDSGHGDLQTEIHGPIPQIRKDLGFQLPFFGSRFNSSKVSINGYLEFSDSKSSNDTASINIFSSRCRIGRLSPKTTDQRRPGVYFRLEHNLQNRTDKFGVQLRERLNRDIHKGMSGSESFQPKHAIIVTWKDVSFAGGIDSALDITNTFQLVLATDEDNTYVIFNYLDINWTTDTESGGDTAMGVGGIPAFVGFKANGGNLTYEYHPYSRKSVIRDLTLKGGVNGFPERHIFKIDDDIMLGNDKTVSRR